MRRTATLALGAVIGIGATLGYQQCTAPNYAQYTPKPGSLDALIGEERGTPWRIVEKVENNERALYLIDNREESNEGVYAKKWMIPDNLPTLLEAREGYGCDLIDGTASGVTGLRKWSAKAYDTVTGWFKKEAPTPMPTPSD